MPTAYVSVLVSAGVLALLVALFGIEQRRGARFLPSVRTWFDSSLENIYAMCARMASRSEDSIRQTFHYVLHHLLQLALGVIRFLERQFNWLLQRNRAIARQTSGTRPMSQTKLREVAEHKAANALTDEEKREHKERSIGTKL